MKEGAACCSADSCLAGGGGSSSCDGEKTGCDATDMGSCLEWPVKAPDALILAAMSFACMAITTRSSFRGTASNLPKAARTMGVSIHCLVVGGV
jgi:hypothetical protein